MLLKKDVKVRGLEIVMLRTLWQEPAGLFRFTVYVGFYRSVL